MEVYQLSSSLPKPIKYGKFKDRVYKVHCDSYGIEGANNILSTASHIFKTSQLQEKNINKNNNTLLVGKVQSGKTSNLEMLSALFFDNGYHLGIVYGGYDTNLLGQSVERFQTTFDTENSEDLYLIHTSEDNFQFYDKSFFESAIEDGKPIFLMSLKRNVALGKVNDILESLYGMGIKAFIIDDEGDQASLNTKKNKAEESSATYGEIKRMKDLLNDPIYYAVTATPQANIFQPDISSLKPDSIHLIKPGNGYNGGDQFHLNDDHIHLIPKNDVDEFERGTIPSSLRKAIDYFILSSVIMNYLGKKSDMIIHSYREINGHEMIYEAVKNLIDYLRAGFEEKDEFFIKETYKVFENLYNSELIPSEIRNKYVFNETFKKQIENVINRVQIIQKNSKNKVDEKTIKKFKHKIYIGGDLLQRGITFKNLTTTYFTRWVTSGGNMDTTLQRARWFGYRGAYLDLCKIFTTLEIKQEFSNLAEIENDLWNQFEMVQNGELDINDIVIDAEDSSLNPTRKNVAVYKKATFSKMWTNQVFGLFNIESIKKNNALFESLYKDYELHPSSVGRNDDRTSCYYFHITREKFLSFAKSCESIFNLSPFKYSELEKAIDTETVCIEIMTSINELIDVRKRSFLNEKISALHQGADTTEMEKQHYKGDSDVICDKNNVCVQVFKICPKLEDDKPREEYTQYMYSIHFPNKKIVYKKKEG